jgi:hypothetical protein
VVWDATTAKSHVTEKIDYVRKARFGTSIKGTRWGRPDDWVGLAAAFNAL